MAELIKNNESVIPQTLEWDGSGALPNFTLPKCPHCGGDMNLFLSKWYFKFGEVSVFDGCLTCLGKLILRGIAALSKVDDLEKQVKVLEEKPRLFLD